MRACVRVGCLYTLLLADLWRHLCNLEMTPTTDPNPLMPFNFPALPPPQNKPHLDSLCCLVHLRHHHGGDGIRRRRHHRLRVQHSRRYGRGRTAVSRPRGAHVCGPARWGPGSGVGGGVGLVVVRGGGGGGGGGDAAAAGLCDLQQLQAHLGDLWMWIIFLVVGGCFGALGGRRSFCRLLQSKHVTISLGESSRASWGNEQTRADRHAYTTPQTAPRPPPLTLPFVSSAISSADTRPTDPFTGDSGADLAAAAAAAGGGWGTWIGRDGPDDGLPGTAEGFSPTSGCESTPPAAAAAAAVASAAGKAASTASLSSAAAEAQAEADTAGGCGSESSRSASPFTAAAAATAVAALGGAAVAASGATDAGAAAGAAAPSSAAGRAVVRSDSSFDRSRTTCVCGDGGAACSVVECIAFGGLRGPTVSQNSNIGKGGSTLLISACLCRHCVMWCTHGRGSSDPLSTTTTHLLFMCWIVAGAAAALGGAGASRGLYSCLWLGRACRAAVAHHCFRRCWRWWHCCCCCCCCCCCRCRCCRRCRCRFCLRFGGSFRGIRWSPLCIDSATTHTAEKHPPKHPPTHPVDSLTASLAAPNATGGGRLLPTNHGGITYTTSMRFEWGDRADEWLAARQWRTATACTNACTTNATPVGGWRRRGCAAPPPCCTGPQSATHLLIDVLVLCLWRQFQHSCFGVSRWRLETSVALERAFAAPTAKSTGATSVGES